MVLKPRLRLKAKAGLPIFVLTFFKNLFVPTEENSAEPYALSLPAFSAYLVVALLLILYPAYTKVSQLASLLEPFSFGGDTMVTLTNQSRAAEGILPLKENATLVRAAEAKLEDMFAKGYFAHVSPEGKTPWSFLTGEGYAYRAAGENLASDFLTGEDAHAALIQSPTHRANIVSPLYTEIGVAVRKGTLNGRPTVLIAEFFGDPRPSILATAPKKPKPIANTPKPVAQAPVPSKQSSTIATTTSVEIAAAPTSVLPIGNTSALLPPTLEATIRQIPPRAAAKTLALIAIASLLIPLALMTTRTVFVSFGIFGRTAVLLGLFLYVAAGNPVRGMFPQTTPISASTLLIEQYRQ